MYESFTIKNFRCFEDLTISDLKRVNLIAGKNNTGKTALLEALFIHSGAYNPELALRVNMFRNSAQLAIDGALKPVLPWDSLFAEFDLSKPVEFSGIDSQWGNRQTWLKVVTDPGKLRQILADSRGSTSVNDLPTSSVSPIQVLSLESKVDSEPVSTYNLVLDQTGASRITVIPPPRYLTVFLLAHARGTPQEDAERFSSLVRSKEDVSVLKALQVIEPRLKSLSVTVLPANTALIMGDIGLDVLVPLSLMGDGLTHLTRIVTAIITARNGIVLIDEIENGLHYSVLGDVWRVIDQTAKEFNTQIFATTHSRECIVAAHEAFESDAEYDFRLHRLDSINGTIRAVTYPQGTLEAAIETNLEVR